MEGFFQGRKLLYEMHFKSIVSKEDPKIVEARATPASKKKYETVYQPNSISRN